MNTSNQISLAMAHGFLARMFQTALSMGVGEIEIRTFKPRAMQSFFSSIQDAAHLTIELCSQGRDVYCGVNLKKGQEGKKENVIAVSAFHTEIDYGHIGHKKDSHFPTYEEALDAIENFCLRPSIVLHSGGGFHCYWVLETPLSVKDYGIEQLEKVNKALTQSLHGDPGTHDISRVLRIPGTFNFKDPENPRRVEVVLENPKVYTMDDFRSLLGVSEAQPDRPEDKPKKQESANSLPLDPVSHNADDLDIASLPISDKMKSLILHGNDGSYPSRSEADLAVIISLISRGMREGEIRQIFQNYPIGEKYREHAAPDDYLNHTIQKARELSNLTEQERQHPLFISGSIVKTEKKYRLNVLKFEEYMVRKYVIKILDRESAFFRYNGRCYEQCTDKMLNNLCQTELASHRDLFSKGCLNELIHYATGDAYIESDKARANQVKYLTLQNGLYDLDANVLTPHSSDIFTTNLLPYNYDPSATCPRFVRFLHEIFEDDQTKIDFVQEAVGYVFHKSLPTPAMFFLIGTGSNGKSVFINTISNLVGKENTSNVSFNALSDEYYILELFQKMINISGETPQGRYINTDIVKAVTSGDWTTGRELYRPPMKFRPFAKHFLAMNKLPVIVDQSHGMRRRIWVLEFNRRFTEKDMDRQLEEKLVNELSGIFNWALEGYRRLKASNFALSEPQSMETAKAEYMDEMDSVRQFEKEHLEKTDDPKAAVTLHEAYSEYQGYCSQSGKKDIQSKNDFKKGLAELGYQIGSSKKHDNKVCINARIIN